MKMTLAVLLALVFVGAGCSYKYDAKWNRQDKSGSEKLATSTESSTSDWPKPGDPGFVCLKEGQPLAGGDVGCCPGLEDIPVDDAYSVCGKPGTGYKPRVCAAPGEIVTAQTPNCCAGLDVKEKDGKFICDYLK